MAITINSNLSHLKQRSGLSGSSTLPQVSQRLTSKIAGSGASDEAGQVEQNQATKLELSNSAAKDPVLQKAARIADDLSMIQTAESAINKQTKIVSNMFSIAVEASNDSLTSTERDELASKFTQLRVQLDDIAEKTEYKGNKLLDGSASEVLDIKSNADFAGRAQNSSFGIEATNSSSLGRDDVKVADLSLSTDYDRGVAKESLFTAQEQLSAQQRKLSSSQREITFRAGEVASEISNRYVSEKFNALFRDDEASERAGQQILDDVSSSVASQASGLSSDALRLLS